jgi:hypothetical protein
MDWEKAIKPGINPFAPDKDERGTITKGGKLSLTPAQDDFLGRPKKVRLFFEPKYRVIGLMACDEGRFSIYRDEGHRSLSIRGLFNRHGIGLTEKLVCPVVWASGGMLEFYLEERQGDEPGEYAWEEFTYKMAHRRAFNPSVTINVVRNKRTKTLDYRLRYNDVIHQALGEPEYVEIGYDPKADMIGFKRAQAGGGRRKVFEKKAKNQRGRSCSYYVAITQLLKDIGYAPKVGKRFEPVVQNGYVEFELHREDSETREALIRAQNMEVQAAIIPEQENNFKAIIAELEEQVAKNTADIARLLALVEQREDAGQTDEFEQADEWKAIDKGGKILNPDLPWLRLLPNGEANIGKAAFDALGSPVAAVWVFDSERRVAGLKAYDPSSDLGDSYPVIRVHENMGTFHVTAKSFCRHSKIDFAKRSTRLFELKAVNGVMVGDAIVDGVLAWYVGSPVPIEQCKFQWFTDKNSSTGAKFRISLYKSGDLNLSPGATRAIGIPKWVKFDFEERTRRVRISPCEETDLNAYKLLPMGWTYNTTGDALINRTGIKPGQRFYGKVEDGGLVFNWDEGSPAKGSKKKKGRRLGTYKVSRTKFLKDSANYIRAYFGEKNKEPTIHWMAKKMGVEDRTYKGWADEFGGGHDTLCESALQTVPLEELTDLRRVWN